MTVDARQEGPRVVRHDQHVGLAQLFCLLGNGPRPKLDVEYVTSGGAVRLHFRGGNALGMPEQTLLLVLMELAQERQYKSFESSILRAEADAEVHRHLWYSLYRDARGEQAETLCFKTTWHELARRAGYAHGGSRQRQTQEQLRRLCECTIWERSKGAEFQSYLVAMVRGDDENVHVALNVRLAEAISGARYMPVSLGERLQLKSNVAQALHAFFSVWLRSDERQRIGVDKLAARLWQRGKGQASPEGTVRRQRNTVRQGLREMSALPGWTITDMDQSIITVERLRTEAGTNSSPGTVRQMPGVRPMPCQNANGDGSLGEQSIEREASNDAGFGGIDASALFISK